MTVRNANAAWKGTLKEGKGLMKLESGAYKGPYTWDSRFAEGPGTNPEELLGAAHAGCFSMFLSGLLTNNGTPPARIETRASVHLGEGPKITNIELVCRARVPNISEETFMQLARSAKVRCPVSQALAGTEILLQASLVP
jgi:osmotically inducible protein OsmC